MWFYFLIGMVKYRYYTQGTCSSQIDLDVDDNGVMSREEAIAKRAGIKCGNKPTSCPDQLAQALKQMP